MSTLPLLWYTSRTPTEVGQRSCAMERFLGYHAGPHGTGYSRKSLSIPLATGSNVHLGAELLAGWIMEYQTKHHGLPPQSLPAEVIAWAASETAARYEAKARAKGFNETGLESVGSNLPPGQLPSAVETLILEQRTLIEAQVWIYALLYLPTVMTRYRLLDAEHEESYVLDCTCGLGDGFGDWTVHQQRGCAGIVQQGRADVLWEGYADDVRGQIIYDEMKTKATQNAPWEKAWEHSGQLLVNMETAARRLGKRITAAHIVVLFKGWRGRDKGDPPEVPKYQHSVLTYGYNDPGADGLRPSAWAAKYRWTDEYGKGHTLPRTYQKQPVWDIQIALPDTGVTVPREGSSRVERWVTQYISNDQWPDLLKVLGPFPHPAARVPLALQAIQAEERRWRDDVDYIRTEVAKGVQEWQAADAIIPRSWQCTKFGGDPCAFKRVCDREPGWEDLLGMGHYQIRRPHHESERIAYEQAGVVFPVDEDDAEFDEIDL